eukprot:1428132-Prymnesium_polylepis.1
MAGSGTATRTQPWRTAHTPARRRIAIDPAHTHTRPRGAQSAPTTGCGCVEPPTPPVGQKPMKAQLGLLRA